MESIWYLGAQVQHWCHTWVKAFTDPEQVTGECSPPAWSFPGVNMARATVSSTAVPTVHSSFLAHSRFSVV